MNNHQCFLRDYFNIIAFILHIYKQLYYQYILNDYMWTI